MLRLLLGSSLVPFALLPGLATAQVNNPADKARERAEAQRVPQEPEPQAPTYRSYEAPRVVVEGRPASELREEDRIGTYQQPRWTANRRFGETRIYVRPEGQAEFEVWVIPEFPKHGDPTETKVQYEFEFGLPHRFQFDLYLVSHQEGNEGPLEIDEEKFEVRWAPANWGVIPTNPTLYLEWAAKNDAPDAIEAKLLLGDEIAPRWHWGANFVVEQETGGQREQGLEVTGGLSYTVVDEGFSIGLETKAAWVNAEHDLDGSANEILIGPSLQLRPLPRAHIDIAPLFGVTDDSPDAKVTLIFGWEF